MSDVVEALAQRYALYRCFVLIEIDNQTKYWLTDPKARELQGNIVLPPASVAPKSRHFMVSQYTLS